jgi:putative nucleotidyltransferase with HDIG domain
MDFGCAAYCKFADQCLGDLPPELLAQREELLKDRVAVEMKRLFGNDFKRIAHASKVARYAEKILYQEGGDPAVVLCAAYLHDIGLRGTRPGEGAGHAQRGSELAAEIMQGLGARRQLAEEVSDIVARHHEAGPEDGLNLRIVSDADRIVNLEEGLRAGSLDREAVASAVESDLLTGSGRETAREALLEGQAG